jgi:hypothetical protein
MTMPKTREEQLAYQRAQYAKHREKRLAAKKATYDPKKNKEKNDRYYAENREKLVQYARAYRAERKEELAAQAKARYYANHEEKKARRRELEKRPEARERQYGYIRRWAERNADKIARYEARRRLVEATGASAAEISDDLADAKAAQLKIARWVREQRAAQGIEARQGGDVKQAPREAREPGPKDAPKGSSHA